MLTSRGCCHDERMTTPPARATPQRRGLLPLLFLSGVVIAVVLGLARGVWVSNLHNGVLGLAFTAVGAWLLRERPGQRLGRLFLATGVVEALMFYGRQVGHAPTGASGEQWWAWLGVWPLALGVGLTTLCVLLFPEGHLPSPGWRWPVGALGVALMVSMTLSAGWPVEYADAGVVLSHPLVLPGGSVADAVWSALAHPSYAVCQLLWLVAVVVRWVTSGALVRRQLAVLVGPVAVSAIALVAGLALWSSPTPGVLAASLVPVGAGWAVIHGRNLAAYKALTWLSRTQGEGHDLPGELAHTIADALGADAAGVWVGDEDALVEAGTWPEIGTELEAVTLADLGGRAEVVRPVTRGGLVRGALTVNRSAAQPLSPSEERLLDDLASQAGLVLEHLTVVDLLNQQQRTGPLPQLTARENEVLELMAQGLSNAAICERLHLSVKTVEPVVSAIFTKLGLHAESSSNRRVLAVVEFLRARER